MLFTGTEIAELFADLGVSDVIWLPDSEFGRWEPALEQAPDLRLLRVCREGEARPLAAGLHVGGRAPVILMQTTGLFESGDALRNVVHDLKVPVFAIIGGRSWLVPGSRDSAKRFARRILDAWKIQWVEVSKEQHKQRLPAHYRRCRAAGRPGIVVVAEGKP